MWELEAERYDPKPQNFDEIHIWNSCFKFEMQFGDVWGLARLWNSMEKFDRS